MAERMNPVSPFLRRGGDTRSAMLGLLACLTVTAAHFGARYDPGFLVRYPLYALFGLGIEILYRLLRDGRFAWPRASTAVTTALLVLSIPSRMPWGQVGSGIFVAVFFGKLTVDRAALRVNPMLLGRLFLMIVFPDSIQQWLPPDAELDVLTSATPLGLYASEGATMSPADLLLGNLSGTWDDFVAILPGSPGEAMPLLSIAFGVVLYATGVLDWRPGVAFLAGFALACRFFGLPILFHALAGSVIFSAVYILTDWRSMPGSKGGRLIGGLLAGILNAWARDYGYYPEGIVLAVLPVNLLSPTLDRLAFAARGAILRARRASESSLNRSPGNRV
jgi:Na+-translocating ferredoxin:NAD+ oxidoreductase subunit D